MDLRSIINPDTAANDTPRSIPNKQGHPYSQQAHPGHYASQQSGTAAPHLDTRPHPLQSPVHYDVQSPYQSTPTSSLISGQYPFPPPASHDQAHNSRMPRFGAQERSTSISAPAGQNYSQPSPSVLTPTTGTPGSGYPYPQYRPPSSHSSLTPTSAQSQVQSFPRDSPRTSYSHINGSVAQGHPAQHSHYHSQPGTPLGPPSQFSRPSPVLHREPSSSQAYEHHRSQSGSSYGAQSMPRPSPTADVSGTVLASPTAYGSRTSVPRHPNHVSNQARQRSLSVSPKTLLPSQPKTGISHEQAWDDQVTPVKRKATEPVSDSGSIVRPDEGTQGHQQPITNGFGNRVNGFGVNGSRADPNHNAVPTSIDTTPSQHLDNQPSSQNQTTADFSVNLPPQKSSNNPPQHHSSIKLAHQQTSTTPSHQETTSTGPSDQQLSVSALHHQQTYNTPSYQQYSINPQHQKSSTPQVIPDQPPPAVQTTQTPPSTSQPPNFAPSTAETVTMPHSQASTASPQSAGSTVEQTRKRQKFTEIPIYARKFNPALAAKPIHAKRSMPARANDARPPTQSSPAVVRAIKEESNGNVAPTNQIPVAQPETGFHASSSLGPWEPTILAITPIQELTKLVSDFLFVEVVNRIDVNPESGAVLEIEAKIGQLIDRDTEERLQLPALSECIVSKNHNNLRTAFKSSMTETEHRAMNNFLNKAVMDSCGRKAGAKPAEFPTTPRIPMTYVHTRETDHFYELSQTVELTLPPSIRARLNPRHNKAKVRVTTDQKTGKELAKIIKVRVADLDVYSPTTVFDYRISVNLEMKYNGDVRDLVEVTEGGRKMPERNKDRMTYKHLAYQIDLTQVTVADGTTAEKEHELEIELSAADVCKHGNVARNGQTSGFNDLVQGFLDNIRVLARHCKVGG